jgi:hypothetical protein
MVVWLERYNIPLVTGKMYSKSDGVGLLER